MYAEGIYMEAISLSWRGSTGLSIYWVCVCFFCPMYACFAAWQTWLMIVAQTGHVVLFDRGWCCVDVVRQLLLQSIFSLVYLYIYCFPFSCCELWQLWILYLFLPCDETIILCLCTHFITGNVHTVLLMLSFLIQYLHCIFSNFSSTEFHMY